MDKFSKVRGNQERVPYLEVNVDTVYVRTNVEWVEEERFTGWQYDEVQYTFREYHELLGNLATATEKENAQLWYENMVLKGQTATMNQEVADLWYHLIKGGEA